MPKTDFYSTFRDAPVAAVIMVVLLTAGDWAAGVVSPVLSDPDPVKVGFASSSTNKDGPKTDFHVDLGGHVPIFVNSATLGGVEGMVTGSGTNNITIDWMGLTVPPNGVVTWKWDGFEQELNITKVLGRFTPPASPTDVPTLGWDVENGEVFLLNDFTADISFDHLLFQFPPDFTADSLAALVLGAPVGVPCLL